MEIIDIESNDNVKQILVYTLRFSKIQNVLKRFFLTEQAEKLKSPEMKDKGWKMNDESWKMKD